jgi:hypothetical protein
LAWLQRVKLDLNTDALPDPDPAPPPNRSQRRQIEKAERVAKATPRGKPGKPVPTMIDHMKHLIADWSLTWDGEPWTVCEESFRLGEPLMRMAMIRTIVEDYLDRPNRMSSSTPSSEATASGPTGLTSASEPSNGATTVQDLAVASSPGSS